MDKHAENQETEGPAERPSEKVVPPMELVIMGNGWTLHLELRIVFHEAGKE